MGSSLFELDFSEQSAFPVRMSAKARLWLIRLLAAAFVVAGSLNGYVSFPAHDGHVGIAHALGFGAAAHHHTHDHASGDHATVSLCHSEAPCQEEPGNAAGHVHVSCCVSVAVAPADFLMERLEAHGSLRVDQGSASPPGQLFYPLLRPPRAFA